MLIDDDRYPSSVAEENKAVDSDFFVTLRKINSQNNLTL
jgi:hypothetical protein